jgi:uncharacterized protein (DUF58 family)
MKTITQQSSFFPFPLLTVRGMVLLSVVLVLPVFGLLGTMTLNALLVLVGLFLAGYFLLLLCDYIAVRRIISQLSLQMSVPSVIYCAVETELELIVESERAKHSFRLWLRPDIPEGAKAAQETYVLDFPQGRSQIMVKHKTTLLARGPVCWRVIHGRISLFHDLVHWQFSTELGRPPEAKVYANPAPGDIRRVKALRRLGPGEIQLDLAGGEGREFDSLRRYTVGDDLRKADWKRSAQGRGLLIKVFRPETHQRINIAVDCSRRMGSWIEQRLQLDYAADAAAYLVKLASRNEDEVGLFAFNHQVVSKIECRKGSRQERLIAEALAGLKVGTLEPNYQLLAQWAHLSRRRSLLVLITSISNPASLEAVCAALLPVRRKHLPLVFALADRDLQDLVWQRAANLDDAYIVAAGVEQLEQIDARVKTLKRSGIECIYCDVAVLPQMLRNKYYELKLSGRL